MPPAAPTPTVRPSQAGPTRPSVRPSRAPVAIPAPSTLAAAPPPTLAAPPPTLAAAPPSTAAAAPAGPGLLQVVVKPWGEVCAVSWKDGERYYMLNDRYGTVSLMPAGYGDQLTRQELVDLVAFLRAAR